eukprot:260366_1
MLHINQLIGTFDKKLIPIKLIYKRYRNCITITVTFTDAEYNFRSLRNKIFSTYKNYGLSKYFDIQTNDGHNINNDADVVNVLQNYNAINDVFIIVTDTKSIKYQGFAIPLHHMKYLINGYIGENIQHKMLQTVKSLIFNYTRFNASCVNKHSPCLQFGHEYEFIDAEINENVKFINNKNEAILKIHCYGNMVITHLFVESTTNYESEPAIVDLNVDGNLHIISLANYERYTHKVRKGGIINIECNNLTLSNGAISACGNESGGTITLNVRNNCYVEKKFTIRAIGCDYDKSLPRIGGTLTINIQNNLTLDSRMNIDINDIRLYNRKLPNINGEVILNIGGHNTYKYWYSDIYFRYGENATIIINGRVYDKYRMKPSQFAELTKANYNNYKDDNSHDERYYIVLLIEGFYRLNNCIKLLMSDIVILICSYFDVRDEWSTGCMHSDFDLSNDNRQILINVKHPCRFHKLIAFGKRTIDINEKSNRNYQWILQLRNYKKRKRTAGKDLPHICCGIGIVHIDVIAAVRFKKFVCDANDEFYCVENANEIDDIKRYFIGWGCKQFGSYHCVNHKHCKYIAQYCFYAWDKVKLTVNGKKNALILDCGKFEYFAPFVKSIKGMNGKYKLAVWLSHPKQAINIC